MAYEIDLLNKSEHRVAGLVHYISFFVGGTSTTDTYLHFLLFFMTCRGCHWRSS
jgi:hypothetical protein